MADAGEYVRGRDDLREWHYGARLDSDGIRRHPQDWKDAAAWTHCICFAAAHRAVEPLMAEVERLRRAIADHRQALIGDTPPEHWRDCANCESADLELWGSAEGSSDADGYQALRDVCRAAGWPFCEEHKRPRRGGHNPCGHLHEPPQPEHHYTCLWPERECLGAPCARMRGDL